MVWPCLANAASRRPFCNGCFLTRISMYTGIVFVRLATQFFSLEKLQVAGTGLEREREKERDRERIKIFVKELDNKPQHMNFLHVIAPQRQGTSLFSVSKE